MPTIASVIVLLKYFVETQLNAGFRSLRLGQIPEIDFQKTSFNYLLI